MSKGLIRTEPVFPPIPTTRFDWMAFLADDEEGNYPTGRGATEAEALRDLCEQLAEMVLDSKEVQ